MNRFASSLAASLSVSCSCTSINLGFGGLDIGAREKQGNPKVDDGFKVAKEKITCIAASVDVDEGFESSGVEETRSTVTNGSRSHTNRRYHDKTASVTTNSGHSSKTALIRKQIRA
uniref:Uncharacterized protein n=1 Tax=Gossypium raimondii TaxID=29730 RepID=A0A0D2MD12_GOSRA|nr:hypothetical protein B456_002G192300 [Gossypium raimondii]